MENKMILSTNRYTEPRSFGKILHCYSEKFNSLPDIPVFKSLKGLKKMFIYPGQGILPHVHENVTTILVPLKGILAQKSRTKNNTTVSKGEVQLQKHTKGDMHIEYNMDSSKNLDCLVYSFSSENKSNCSEVFKLQQKSNSIQKVLESKLINEKEETARFYFADFNLNETKTVYFEKSDEGIIIYMVSGEMIIEGEPKTVQKNDTLVLWNKESITFKTIQRSKFFLLEISA